MLDAVIRSVYSFDCVEVGDGGDCISRMGVFNCLPVILRLPGNSSAAGSGRHGVGSRSGSIVSPPASYPLRFRILCPIATSRCPVPPHPVPIQSRLASFRLIRPIPLIASLPSLSSPSRPACRIDRRGGFSKRIEFDAFKIRAAERLLSCCLLTVIRVPCRPVGSSHPLIEMCLAISLFTAAPSHH